jgi:hypothetical protein
MIPFFEHDISLILQRSLMSNERDIRLAKFGGYMSLLIGLPVGFSAILLSLYLLIGRSDEGLAIMGFLIMYGFSVLGLSVSFIFSLWFAGRRIAGNLIKGDSILRASYKYSFTVNSIIWTVFILLSYRKDMGLQNVVFSIPPLILGLVCAVCTTFTLGLLICSIVDRRLGHFSV